MTDTRPATQSPDRPNEKFKGKLKLKLNDGETRMLDAVVDAADLPN